MVFEILATMSTGLFAGAALYISLVEHPARMECGTQLAATEFGPSYRRAAVMQASLAIMGMVAAILAWLQVPRPPVLIGGLLLGLVIPFTLVVIFPTNKRLLEPALDRSSSEATALLVRWGRLHAVRSALSTLAFGVLLWGLLGRPQENTTTPTRRGIVPLVVLDDRLAICRLASTDPLPSWATAAEGEFFSATRTMNELSIILADSRAPKDVKCERGWRLLRVQGSLDFNQVGIIAGLSGALADAGVSIFALSTYDTDYVMVKLADLDRAVAALREAGYTVTQS